MNIRSIYENSSNIITLVYEIKEEKVITIFHPFFVKNNKINCKMIINNKICELTDKYQINEQNLKKLEVKLLIINNNKINLSLMFYNCKYLKEFYLASKDKKKSKEKNKDKNINNQTKSLNVDTLDTLNNESNKKFIYEYNNYINNILNKEIKLYYNYNSEKEYDENMNTIINISHEYLSPSYSSIELRNNNSNDYISINENSWKTKGLNFIKNSYIKGKNSGKNNILVTDLSYMFSGCSSLFSITGLSKIDTCYKSIAYI